MTNYVDNASGLDGYLGWSSNLAQTVADETAWGSPGRISIVASGASPGGTTYLDAQTREFPPQQPLWVQVLWMASHVGYPVVIWLNAASQEVTRQAIPTLSYSSSGKAARGIPSRLNRSAGRVTPPAGAVRALVRVQMDGLAPGTQSFVIMHRPLLGDQGECWTPGRHSQNPDLDLMSWPGGLEPRSDSWSATPTGVRVGFQTDSRIPITTQVATEPWVLASFSMALDLGQRDDLDTFWRSTKGVPFWYVRPDTHQLCRAWWTEDGDPSDNGMGRSRRTEVGLLLEPT